MEFGLSLSKLLPWAKASEIEKLKTELKKSGDDNGKRISFKLTKHRTFKADMQQDELRQAIDFAEDPIRPDKTLLLAIYKQAIRDAHLMSQIRTNTLKAVGSPWAYFIEGTDEIDEKLTKLMQKKWFHQYRKFYHEKDWWGHQLVEFQKMKPSTEEGMTLEFDKVKIFPREYVKPHIGHIVLDPSAEKGVPYNEPPFNRWIIEMGDADDLGLLSISAKEVIWKNYSRTDWSRRGEKFGLPMLAIKSSSRDDKELDKLEEMASEFGNNLWIILDDEDKVEVIDPTKSDGHKIYEDKARFCDEQNSKVASGQTGSSDQKAYVGAADVHENILNEYMEEAMRDETYHNNDELKAFLIMHGYPVEGREFRYLAFDKEEEEVEENDGDQFPSKKKKPDKGITANFTKPSATIVAEGGLGTLTQRIEDIYQPSCCEISTLTPTAASGGGISHLEKLAARASKRIYDRKLKAGQIDYDLWLATVEELWSGVTEGYGKQIDAVKYGSPDHIMLTQLRYNTQVFAAFKNHHNVNELVKALVDDDGKVRSFSAFKKAAGGINAKYNKNWIKTEYNQAILSARNAQRWQKIEARKHIFPTVEYVAVVDDRISPVCRDLHGGVWSVDDPILDRIATGNHWGCRSILRSSKKPVNKKVTSEQINKSFLNNPGKTGHPFGESHPYYDVQDQYADAAKRVFGLATLLPIRGTGLQRNLKLWESLDPKQYKKTAYPASGGFMAIHKSADKNDLARNTKVAEAMGKNGYAVEIRKHVEDGTPNPELMINGILSDVKSPKAAYSLDSRLQAAVKKQGLNNVVFEVTKRESVDALTKGLKRGFHNRSKIEWVDVVLGDKVVRITRVMYERGVISKELDKLYK